jgi:hypothetical protein
MSGRISLRAHGDERVTCLLCEDKGWVCENHPDSPLPDCTLADVAAPACPAPGAIRRQDGTTRRGSRGAFSRITSEAAGPDATSVAFRCEKAIHGRAGPSCGSLTKERFLQMLDLV